MADISKLSGQLLGSGVAGGMPHMTGDKFAMELKQIRDDIRIILCTVIATKSVLKLLRRLALLTSQKLAVP